MNTLFIILLALPWLIILGTVIYAVWQAVGARRLAIKEYDAKLAFYEGQQGDNPSHWLRPIGYDEQGNKQYIRESIPADEPDKKQVIREAMRRERNRWFGGKK